jgi:hypothetical protein
MPRRSTPAVLPASEVPDPFSAASPVTPTKTAKSATDAPASFEAWIASSEGVKCSDLDRLIEVLARGNPVRSKLAVIDRLRSAFAAGQA